MLLNEIIPSHQLAAFIMKGIDSLLDKVGLEKTPRVEEVVYVAIVVALAIAIGWCVRVLVLTVAQKIVSLRHSDFGDQLLHQHILTKGSHVITPLVILALIPFAFVKGDILLTIFEKCMVVYTIIVFVVAINAVFDFVWLRYDLRENTKNLPLKGILNVAKGIVWIIATIIAVSYVLDKSPAVLLTGLGAFAAALMLIFKDSILGFVAGIQLSQNDMLHVGDWIVVPSTPADGIVIDVSLSAVKVQNFDNTIVTCPPYTLISTSFQNWRGMTDSGCRRIARTMTFDMDSITTCDDAFLDSVAAKLPLLKPFIDKSRQSATPVFDKGTDAVNGTVETNLGLFRAYMCAWLLQNPSIRHDRLILVRGMQPTGIGLPVQIWCFTATTVWVEYEAIQSEIFEHIAIVAPIFGLRIFNYSAGTSTTSIEFTNPIPTAPVEPPK